MKTATTAAPVDTTATQEAAAPKISKMAKCQIIYDEVFTPGYDLGGKGQRAVFIARAIAEKAMTKSGANTYYQNLSNKARGKGLYKYNKYQGKAGSKSDVAAKAGAAPAEAGLDLPGAPTLTKTQIKAAEDAANKTSADLTKRWQVLDDGVVINTYGSREQAKKAATGGLTWADSKAAK